MADFKETYYETKYGKFLLGNSIDLLKGKLSKKLNGNVDLLITSPPFPLNNKKKYGNLQGKEYKEWFKSLASVFEDLLSDNGSIIIEIGNAWEPGRPVQSLLHLESLLGLVQNSNLRLIQEFICYNPSKLPSPAQWVTINRIRTVDSYTHIWWLAKSDYPKADNNKVLRPYSKSMKRLLDKKSYNNGKRPSGHVISQNGFLTDHGGSISHNFFELEPINNKREVRLPNNVLSFSNTTSNDYFQKLCRKKNIVLHPARMNIGIVNFFIDFLTDENDFVLDPFAGSNTTGYCCEKKNRNWLGIEINVEFANQSIYRFKEPNNNFKLRKIKKP